VIVYVYSIDYIKRGRRCYAAPAVFSNLMGPYVFPSFSELVALPVAAPSIQRTHTYLLNNPMLHMAQDKTVIFISHRLSTTKKADRIIMMEEGEIIEQGTHEQLMKQEGKYAEMFTIQAQKYGQDSAMETALAH